MLRNPLDFSSKLAIESNQRAQHNVFMKTYKTQTDAGF